MAKNTGGVAHGESGHGKNNARDSKDLSHNAVMSPLTKFLAPRRS